MRDGCQKSLGAIGYIGRHGGENVQPFNTVLDFSGRLGNCLNSMPLLKQLDFRYIGIKSFKNEMMSLKDLRNLKKVLEGFCIFILNKPLKKLRFEGVYNLLEESIIVVASTSEEKRVYDVLFHELAHWFGVPHCENETCIMSGKVGSVLCWHCKRKFYKEFISSLNDACICTHTKVKNMKTIKYTVQLDGKTVEIQATTVDEIQEMLPQVASLLNTEMANVVAAATPVSQEVHIPMLANAGGLADAIRIMVEGRFFDAPRTAAETRAVLKENTLHYAQGAVSTQLTRAVRSGLLRRFKDNEVYKYVRAPRK